MGNDNGSTAVIIQTTEGKKIVNVHCYTVRGEATSGGLVLEAAEVILSANILQLGVIFERVNGALSLDGVGALLVVVVREEELLGPVELGPAPDRFLRPIVPPYPHPHVATVICLDLLHPRHIWQLV